MEYVNLVYPNTLIYHTANERQCTTQVGAKLKRMGVLAGVSDYTIFASSSCGNYKMMMLEVKTEKGRVTLPQKEFAKRLPDWVCFKVAYGLDECIKTIREYIDGDI